MVSLLEEYGDRFRAVIESAPSPREAMEAIAQEAEKFGWIFSASDLRRESSLVFVMDLWTDNPVVLDRLNMHGEQLPDPMSIEQLSDVLEIFR